jgi:hypothetical protein
MWGCKQNSLFRRTPKRRTGNEQHDMLKIPPGAEGEQN